jgi:hypothetical protein
MAAVTVEVAAAVFTAGVVLAVGVSTGVATVVATTAAGLAATVGECPAAAAGMAVGVGTAVGVGIHPRHEVSEGVARAQAGLGLSRGTAPAWPDRGVRGLPTGNGIPLAAFAVAL